MAPLTSVIFLALAMKRPSFLPMSARYVPSDVVDVVVSQCHSP